MNNLKETIERIGYTKIAKACGVTRQAVQGWRNHGLPSTDFPQPATTKYGKIIAKLAKG